MVLYVQSQIVIPPTCPWTNNAGFRLAASQVFDFSVWAPRKTMARSGLHFRLHSPVCVHDDSTRIEEMFFLLYKVPTQGGTSGNDGCTRLGPLP